MVPDSWGNVRYYSCGDRIQVLVGAVIVPMNVVVDLGGTEVIVTPDVSPSDSKRVKRSDIKVPRQKKFSCVNTEKGLCVTQRQAGGVSKKEVAEGVLTMCGSWVVSVMGTQKEEPTCKECLNVVRDE